MTLASCMDRLSSNKHEPRVKMTEANDLKITEMKKHPRYSDGLDVGIAIAEEEFIFTNTVRPVCLPNFPDDPVSKSRTLILQQFVSDPEENTMQLNQREITEELCKGNIKVITCIEPRDLRVTEGSPVVKMVCTRIH